MSSSSPSYSAVNPSERLEEVGRALFGIHWQSDLARALGVSDRTVRNWATGGKITDRSWQKILSLCEARAAMLQDVVETLRLPVVG